MQVKRPRQQQTDCKDAIIKRKNAQRSPRIKLSEVTAVINRVVQNSRNQETGQYKEEVDAEETIKEYMAYGTDQKTA